MKYVDAENFIKRFEQSMVLFGKTGDVLDADEQCKLAHYAKIVSKDGNDTHFIRVFQSTPFDPSGPYGRRERNLDTQMKRVSKNTFDLYVTYLKTNNSIYLTKAQRGFLND